MKSYKIIFSNNDKCLQKDVCAENMEDAEKMAYQMAEAKSREFDEFSVMEIPTEPSVIGIRFEYYDTCFKKSFSDYIHIKANDEKEACDYYNENYKGGRFWFQASDTDETGKCIRGNILETFYAACPGYDADATK